MRRCCRWPAGAGWDVLRFDRLGRRLKTAAALGAAAGAGGMGSVVIARRVRTSRPVRVARQLRSRGHRRLPARRHR